MVELSPLRKGRLTGSRIGKLMAGTALEIDQLFRVVIGEVPEPDLSDDWNAQRGRATEGANLDRFEYRNRMAVERRGEFVPHPTVPWAGVTLDGFIGDMNAPIEAKDVLGNEPLEVVVMRYYPQLTLTMECTQTRQIALSVIIAGKEPVVEWLDFDEKYAAAMMARGELFMRAVRAGRSPVELPPAPIPVIADKRYDMTRNNAWAAYAWVWLSTKDVAVANENAAKTLKELMPDNAKVAEGHGVRISRNRAGAKSIRKMHEREEE